MSKYHFPCLYIELPQRDCDIDITKVTIIISMTPQHYTVVGPSSRHHRYFTVFSPIVTILSVILSWYSSIFFIFVVDFWWFLWVSRGHFFLVIHSAPIYRFWGSREWKKDEEILKRRDPRFQFFTLFNVYTIPEFDFEPYRLSYSISECNNRHTKPLTLTITHISIKLISWRLFFEFCLEVNFCYPMSSFGDESFYWCGQINF